jgi:hypothetical protein
MDAASYYAQYEHQLEQEQYIPEVTELIQPTGPTVMSTYDTSSTDPYYGNVDQEHETLSHQQQQLPTLPDPSDLSEIVPAGTEFMQPTGKTVMSTYDTSCTDPYYGNVCQPQETLSHQQQQLPTLPDTSDLSEIVPAGAEFMQPARKTVMRTYHTSSTDP